MKRKNTIKNLSIFALIFSIMSCESFLDEKPRKDIIVPNKLSDLQAILDNGNVMNQFAGITTISTDELLISETAIIGLSNPIVEGNSYYWKEDLLEGRNITEWSSNYSIILNSNIILAQLDEIDRTIENRADWDRIKGSALFFRGMATYDLARIFSKQYNPISADSDLGIPIRTNPRINSKVSRSSLKATFEQIVSDLEEASELLPDTFNQFPTRPSKKACFALLGRVSLQMGNYAKAEYYTDLCFELGVDLIDYNELNPNAPFPINMFNREVIFHTVMVSYSFITRPLVFINPELIDLYENNDLRKQIFFRPATVQNRFNFKGHYTGNLRGFNGIASDEIYLISSESKIRNGNIEKGMERLNYLLKYRWKSGVFIPKVAQNEEMALRIIQEERRKTLIFRGLRWDDLRRFNQDPRFQTTISRKLDDGSIIHLAPNSLRYTFPIPQSELSLNPIEQNNRND